jgi:hypothetical protein
MPISYLPPEESAKITRQFTEKDYKVSEFTVEKIKLTLKKWGYTIREKEEDYKVDIIATKNGLQYRFEIEERRRDGQFSSRGSFTYPQVNFLARKIRYAYGGDYVYLILSQSSPCMIMRHSQDIFIQEQSRMVMCNSDAHSGPDAVYVVPTKECYFFNEDTDVKLKIGDNILYKDKPIKVVGMDIRKHELGNLSVEMCYELENENGKKNSQRISHIHDLLDKGIIKII